MTSGVREWWRQPDHFYWLSALLTARGAQRGTRRLFALSLAGFAGVVLVTLGSPAGPQGRLGWTVAFVVAILLLALAVTWLVHGWLSRAQSAGFVVVTAACISAACLIQADPFNGMFGATAFAVLAGYIAFFHTPRYMVFNFAAAIATSAVLAVRLAEAGDPALAVSTLLFLALVNFGVPFACQSLVQMLGINVLNTEIDPLTGLLNEEAFYRTAASFIAARNRDDDRYLVIVVVDLDSFGVLTQTEGRVAGERARVAVGQTLRETTRQNAVIAHVPETEFLIVDSFPTTDSSALVERVRSAIKVTPPRTSASFGVVATPMRGLAQHPPYEVLAELISIGRNAVREARRGGGNQAHYVVRPSLNACEGDEPPRS
jgi:diguanylate cyclase (GGDEF)-like protein